MQCVYSNMLIVSTHVLPASATCFFVLWSVCILCLLCPIALPAFATCFVPHGRSACYVCCAHLFHLPYPLLPLAFCPMVGLHAMSDSPDCSARSCHLLFFLHHGRSACCPLLSLAFFFLLHGRSVCYVWCTRLSAACSTRFCHSLFCLMVRLHAMSAVPASVVSVSTR